MSELDLSFLPAVNATLNGLAGVLLVVGLILIKRGQRKAHQRVMLTAFIVSGLFLVTYLTHYYWRATVKGGTHTRYEGPATFIYYPMLISHILLAMTVPVLAILLIRFGLKQQFDRHKRLARVAWPIWMYVSVTGVAIYVMLYHLQ